ncbi:MAG: hypothetical protein H7199_10010 [Burkholderiales bacterium]|nr:hypothetical protein [Flavobacterium sp.]
MYFTGTLIYLNYFFFLNKKSEKLFLKNSDQILENKKQGKDTTSLEYEIDVKVYHLHDLSDDEAIVIDATSSKEDYEKF